MLAELLVELAFTSKFEHKEYALLVMEVSVKPQYVRMSVCNCQYTGGVVTDSSTLDSAGFQSLSVSVFLPCSV
jgi:hypothetical protein